MSTKSVVTAAKKRKNTKKKDVHNKKAKSRSGEKDGTSLTSSLTPKTKNSKKKGKKNKRDTKRMELKANATAPKVASKRKAAAQVIGTEKRKKTKKAIDGKVLEPNSKKEKSKQENKRTKPTAPATKVAKCTASMKTGAHASTKDGFAYFYP